MSFDSYLVEKESLVINGWIKNCGDGTILNGVPIPGCENVPEEIYYTVTLLKWKKILCGLGKSPITITYRFCTSSADDDTCISNLFYHFLRAY